jgi:hypothetical protein
MKETSYNQQLKEALNSGKSPEQVAREFHIKEKDVKELRTLKGEALEERITKGMFGDG